MRKVLRNQRGDILLEMILIIAVMAIATFFVSTSIFKPTNTPNQDTHEITQEETVVENTLTHEELASETKKAIVVLGSVVLVTLFFICAWFLTYFLYQKQKRGPQTLDEVLRFMIRKKPHRVFTLLEATNNQYTYQYTILKYQWVLHVTPSVIDIKMNRKDKQALHITYDNTTKTFTRKNVKSHVFGDEKTLKKLEKFVTLIVSTDWNKRLSFTLVSDTEDLNKEIPLETTPVEHTIITNPMLELQTQLENIIKDQKIKTRFQTVVQNMHALQHYHMDLDVETKHVIEYSLTNDLTRLLALYEDLNESQKETMGEEIRKRLDLMNEKVEQIKVKVDAKKVNEIKRALHVFDKRYKV